jgi:hypothetical protein
MICLLASLKAAFESVTLLNSFSFADDSALIVQGEQTVFKFLEIFKSWYKENFFNININKSGILSAGQVNLSRHSDFSLSGDTLRNLQCIEYFWFDLSNTGSWDKTTKRFGQKSLGILHPYSKFFSSFDIFFKLKLQIAKSIVLSILLYMISLSNSELWNFERVLRRTLRTIFHQPFG